VFIFENMAGTEWNFKMWFVVMVMVFNTTFNNISVISWPSVLLVEETRVPVENKHGQYNNRVNECL
jgi:hypothetical protein